LMKKNDKIVDVCPKCSELMKMNEDDSYSLGTRLNVFSCSNCNYRGFPVKVKATDLPKLCAKLKK